MPWWIPFTAGFEDGLNPCSLMTGTVLLVLRLWLERKGIGSKKFLVVFIVSLFAVNLVLNLGFFISIFSGNVFEQTAVFIYRALALVFAALGGVFFYDWALLLKGKDRQSLLTTRLFQSGMSSPKFKLIYAAVIGLAGVMSVLSSIWPANYYITLVGNNLYLPGRFLGTAGFLALYASVQMWLIVFLAALFSWGRVTPRLRQVMSAAVFLSAAVAIIYIS